MSNRSTNRSDMSKFEEILNICSSIRRLLITTCRRCRPRSDRIETPAILKKCISARVALAELKQAAELIPNAGVLVNALPLLEAQASSEIENIVTTTDRLFEYVDMPEHRADAATKETLRYRRALFEGARKVQNGAITIDTAIDVCRTIKDEALEIRSKPGTTLAQQRERPRHLHAARRICLDPREARELAALSRGRKRARSADSRRDAALPVRSDPPVHGRQRPHGPHPEHSVSRAARAARHIRSCI